jgi:hypothetical protein
MSTTTRELPHLDLSLANEWNSWDDLVQVGLAQVEIEYEYEPGQELILRPDPDDCQEGFPDRVSVYRIKLTEDLHFVGDVSETKIKAGTFLWDCLASPVRVERLSPSEVSKLEDEILTSEREYA